MKPFHAILIAGILTSPSFGQYSAFLAEHSFRYVATPGFVNIAEFNAGYGLKDFSQESGQTEPGSIQSKYYFGITNIFGYQIDRHFSGGIGVGYLHYEGGDLFPVFLEYKFSMYLKQFTLYFYADGGGLLDPTKFYDESKIFINPGLGISRTLTPRLEINLSTGYMIQARTTLTRVTFLNFRMGVSFRNNAFRMFREG